MKKDRKPKITIVEFFDISTSTLINILDEINSNADDVFNECSCKKLAGISYGITTERQYKNFIIREYKKGLKK